MISRFTDKEKRKILKEGSAGGRIATICKKYCISLSTFYRWKARQSSEPMDYATHVRFLEEENRRLKHRVAELYLDYNSLRSALVSERGSEC
jgi:putative transposase